ncbi:MAG: hypothetical protein ACYSWU_08320 [Planctomycetota bacterium]|jgi:hypothetical protein
MVRFKELSSKNFLEPRDACQTVISGNFATPWWPSRVRSAILDAISLGQFTLAYTRGWAANSPNSRVRLKADLDRAHQEITLSREEIRIHKLRMTQHPTHRRPHYRPTERMAILQLKAARGWSLEQTAQEFLVTADTIR